MLPKAYEECKTIRNETKLVANKLKRAHWEILGYIFKNDGERFLRTTK